MKTNANPITQGKPTFGIVSSDLIFNMKRLLRAQSMEWRLVRQLTHGEGQITLLVEEKTGQMVHDDRLATM